MNFYRIFVALMITILTCFTATSFADVFDYRNIKPGTNEFAIQIGCGKTVSFPEGSRVPLIDFDTFAVRYGVFTSSNVEWGVELFFGRELSGDNNAYSAILNYRQFFYKKQRYAFSYDLGLGVMGMAKSMPGQATVLNFNEHAGLTIHYSISKQEAISVNYRYYHASNAGMEQPNTGINACMLSLAYSYYW